MEPGPYALVTRLDDVSLVARAQAGDEDAFALLVSERQDQLYRLAWSILRHDADAFDAVQDTCIRIWRELPRLRDPGRFDAWLMRSIVNRCRDLLRARKRTKVREISITPDSRGLPVAPGGGLDNAYADSEAIQRAFERLKPDERTYIGLHYADGRSIAEIAALVGAPEGTVKWRLSRARGALERQLARQDR